MNIRKYLKEGKDESNPKYAFQGLNTDLVVAFAAGTYNAQEYAKHELQSRGFDKKGKWVGFPESEKIWKAKVK